MWTDRRLLAAPLAVGMLLLVGPARAETAAGAAAKSAIGGWDAFAEGVRTLPERMLMKLPEQQRSDPQVQQEVGRLALAALANATLDALASDADHPAFIPRIGQVLNVGQPNADTVYRAARVSASGVYRLRGVRGSLRMFNITEAPPGPWEPGFVRGQGEPRPVHDFNALKVDANGRFDVVLSQERPAGYAGDWWKMSPTTNKLLMRMVSSDWRGEAAPTISIERIDTPVTRPRPAGAELERRLDALPAQINFMGILYVDHVESLRREGYVNRLKIIDQSMGGLLTGQFYYEGAYDLADDEALLVEAKAPAKCLYRSIILTNGLYETTDWYNNHSSLNDSQAKVDKDGVLRIVISARDPGTPNWLDTAGYQQGLVQGRWTGCDATPIPNARKVVLADVRKLLPAQTPSVTPPQREQTIRERRAALSERPLW